MPFDPFHALSRLERVSPALARFSAMACLSLLSPFNGHLCASLREWSERRCVIRLKKCRSVRNHVGGIHAGALFTLGETCAGLVIIRNFPFSSYRPLMSDVRVTYSKQGRGTVSGECDFSPDVLARMHETIDRGEVPSVDMETRILNADREIVAVVSTTWQVKPWSLVRKPGDVPAIP